MSLDQVRKESEKDRKVIVYTHWGEEYEKVQARLKSKAHEFIDAGAEVVIGSHPHVVGEVEMYKGKQIFYSLGNFVFDQYWTESVREGALLYLKFNKKGLESYRMMPIEMKSDGRTCLIPKAL